MDTTNSSEKPQRRVKHGQRPTEPLADWPAEFGAAGAEQPAATSGDAPADLQQLKALALAATPGPWTATHWNGHAPTTVMRTGTTMAIAETTGFGRDSSECAPDAAYIAAANPAVVLGLIARIESAAAPAPSDCSNCFDGKTEFDHVCPTCKGSGQAPATTSGDELPPSQITNTTSARKFMDAWHRKHFPTDRTFSRYIMADPPRSNPLAGDFAWQLAKALEAMEARAAASASTKPTADLDTMLAVIEKAAATVRAFGTGQMTAGDAYASLLATKPAASQAGRILARVTKEMRDAGLVEANRRDCDADSSDVEMIFEAMLAATPAASTTGAAQTAEQVRDQALEEAAKTAEATRVAQVQYGLSIFQDGDGTRDDIATAIRALKSRPTPTHSSEAGDAN